MPAAPPDALVSHLSGVQRMKVGIVILKPLRVPPALLQAVPFPALDFRNSSSPANPASSFLAASRTHPDFPDRASPVTSRPSLFLLPHFVHCPLSSATPVAPAASGNLHPDTPSTSHFLPVVLSQFRVDSASLCKLRLQHRQILLRKLHSSRHFFLPRLSSFTCRVSAHLRTDLRFLFERLALATSRVTCACPIAASFSH